MSVWNRKRLSFGFISTRFAGTDGVSLETEKWVNVLKAKGCDVSYMAGKLDTDPQISHLAPKAFFKHEDILEVQDALFVNKRRTREISRRVDELKNQLKAEIEEFYRRFNFEILVVQNILALPVNIPLSLLNRKLEQEVLSLFDYRAGMSGDAVAPLITFKKEEKLGIGE